MKKYIFIAFLSFICTSLTAQNFEVPKNYKLKAKEDYKPYEPQVLEAIDWALSTPLNKEEAKRKETYAFLLAWMSGTPDVSLKIDSYIANLTKKNSELLFVFMMGWTRYALTNDYSKDDLQGTKTGIETLVHFYETNKGSLKKDKEIEKHQKLMENGKLEEELKKKFK